MQPGLPGQPASSGPARGCGVTEPELARPVQARSVWLGSDRSFWWTFGLGWQCAQASGLVRSVRWFTCATCAPPPAENTSASGATTGGAAACFASAPVVDSRLSVPWQPVQLAASPFACLWQPAQGVS